MEKNLIVKIVPCEDSVFFRENVPDDVKLTKDLVELNYGYLSPFDEADLFYLKEGKELYIWFFKKDRSKVSIPECLILYGSLKGKRDGIYVYKKQNGKCVISVLKKGILLEQVIVECEELESVLSILTTKYSMSRNAIFEIDKLNIGNFQVVKFLVKKFLQDLYQLSIHNKEVFLLFVVTVMYAIVLAKFLSVAYLRYEADRLSSQAGELIKSLQSEQKKFLYLEESALTWKSISQLVTLDKIFLVYTRILKTLEENDVRIQSISMTPSEIKIEVLAKDPSFLKGLLNVPFVSNVNLISSSVFGKLNKYLLKITVSWTEIKC